MTDLTIQSTIPASVGRMRKTLDAQASAVHVGGTFLRLRGEGNASAGHFTADDARRLGEWLATRYGLAPYTDAKVGEVVRILPNAERYDGDEVDFPDVTRAKVVHGPDCDGEYSVEIIDGDDQGETFFVSTHFIRHADAILPEAEKPAETPTPAAPTFAEGTPVVIVADEARSPLGRVLDLAKGTPAVVVRPAAPAVGPGYLIRVTTAEGLAEKLVRAEDVALAMPAEEPAKATEVVAGREYRLLPGSRYTQGEPTYFASDVTRVRVTSDVKGDGNVRAKALDGSKPGEEWHVDPKYLAEIAETPATPAPLKVGDVVSLKPGAKTSAGGGVYFAADVTRVKVLRGADGEGDYRVENVDGSGDTFGTSRASQYVGRAWLGDPEPAPKTGPLEVGEEAVFLEDYNGGTYRKGDRVKVLEVETRYVSSPMVRFERLSDGRRGGCFAYRLARPEAERPWAVGDAAIVTDGGRYADGFRTGERVQITHVGTRVDENGHRQVRATSTERYGVNWYTRTDSIRRP